MKVIHIIKFFPDIIFHTTYSDVKKVPNKLNSQKLDHKHLKVSVRKKRKQAGNGIGRRHM